MLDYKNVVEEQLGYQEANKIMMGDDFPETVPKEDLRRPVIIDDSLNEIHKERNMATFGITNRKHINPFLNTILKSFKNTEGIFRRSETESSRSDQETVVGKCWALEKFEPKLLLGKLVRRKCTRKSNFDGNFLSIMTSILNKYVDAQFKFTEEMTEILLENIFGKNIDLRNNIFDVNKLLKFLRNSLDLHKSHTKNEITLKSRHCLSISLPGCFCRRGYVENSGQCVAPSDCVRSEYYTQYLSRIIVL